MAFLIPRNSSSLLQSTLNNLIFSNIPSKYIALVYDLLTESVCFTLQKPRWRQKSLPSRIHQTSFKAPGKYESALHFLSVTALHCRLTFISWLVMRPECFSTVLLLSHPIYLLLDLCSLEDDLAFTYCISALLMKLFCSLSRTHSIFPHT